MDLDKPSSPATHKAASNGAASDRSRLDKLLSRSSSRVGALRLALAVASLYVILWVSADYLIVHVATSSSGVSSDQVLLATPNLRTEEPQETQQHVSPASNASEANSTATQAKRCEAMSMGHIEKEFYRPESCFSRSDIQQIILGLVWSLTEVLKTNDIPYWLDSGTLLGSYREKTIIPYDMDADIGITEASYFQLRDHQFSFSSEYELQVYEGKFHRSDPRDANVPARFVHKDSGLYVDIFVFLDNATNPTMFGPFPSVCFRACHRCPRKAGWTREFTIPRDWVYPLQVCEFGGHTVSCPAKPELYLDYLYGPDFMTPDEKAR